MPELDPDIAALIARLAAEPGRPKLYELPPAEARRLYVQTTAPPRPATTRRTRRSPTARSRARAARSASARSRPQASAPPHPAWCSSMGGGWVLGGFETHDRACRWLAARIGAVVVSVEYRLAPAHAFPAARGGRACPRPPSWRTMRRSSASTRTGSPWAATPPAARSPPWWPISPRDEGLGTRPPAADLPRHHRTHRHKLLPRERHRLPARAAPRWSGSSRSTRAATLDRDNPLFAPLRSPNLEGLAPATVVTAGFDPLRDDGELYAAALRKSGVAVRHLAFPSLPHGFLLMDAVSRGADAACVAIAEAWRPLSPPPVGAGPARQP